MVSNDDHLCVARQSSKNRLEGLTSRRVNTKIVNDEYKIESRLFKWGEGRGEKKWAYKSKWIPLKSNNNERQRQRICISFGMSRCSNR